jgi:nitroreductase
MTGFVSALPEGIMKVSEAVASRFSARAFTDREVPFETVYRIVDRARQAPSGGNLQPWHVHVLGGNAIVAFKALVAERARANPSGEEPEFALYPPNLAEPYRSRRYRCGEDLYASIGVGRDDRAGRLRQLAKNFGFFGAPVALFFTLERFMGPGQWAHLGMLIQTIMLLAREEGLHTCAQEVWTGWHETVCEFLDVPDDQMLYCGMALGHADMEAPINQWRTDRAPMNEVVAFHGFGDSA